MCLTLGRQPYRLYCNTFRQPGGPTPQPQTWWTNVFQSISLNIAQPDMVSGMTMVKNCNVIDENEIL